MINKNNQKGGYVVIFNTLIFVAVSSFVIYALAAPLLSNHRAAGDILNSKRAFIVGESGLEETLYKMKNQMNVPTSDTLELDGAEATMAVSTSFGGKTVQVSGVEYDVTRDFQVSVSETVGTSFSYGLQTGQGGFDLYGGAKVYGNIYSNGNVFGHGGANVYGSVTVANGSSPSVEVSNGSIGTPAEQVIFGGQLVWNDPKPEDLAQSFTVSTTTPITSVRIYIRKHANVWMNDATVSIVNNSNGKPGNTTLTSASLSAGQVTTSYNYLTLPFSSSVQLVPDNTYWLVIDTKNTWNSYYVLGANQNGYTDGTVKVKNENSNSWINHTPDNLDVFFDVLVGGETGGISGLQNNRITIQDDAWANNISGANVGGVMYCQGATYSNKSCDTSRPDPTQQPYPISDGNIEAWKTEAEEGGIQSGSVTVGPWPNQHVTMGGRKIEGDLTVTSGGSLTLEGTLWVTGDIVVTGGATLRLAESYGGNSGVIVTDGRVTVTGGGNVAGNGVPGNYILIVTSSGCPDGAGCGGNNAITLSGGAGSVILNAQNGTLRVTGGAEAKQLTAKRIIMDGGTEVHYETGLMDMNFNSGPSGSWSISDWQEI